MQDCNPSYHGGWGRRCSKPAWATEWVTGLKCKSKSRIWSNVKVLAGIMNLYNQLLDRGMGWSMKYTGLLSFICNILVVCNSSMSLAVAYSFLLNFSMPSAMPAKSLDYWQKIYYQEYSRDKGLGCLTHEPLHRSALWQSRSQLTEWGHKQRGGRSKLQCLL